MNALSISVVKRDAKDDLLVQTEKLRKLAADEIEKLKAAGKHELAAGIEKLDKIVIDLETQLQGLNPQTAIGKGLLAVVEAGLKRVETAMEAEIKKLSGSFYADDELAKLLAQLEEAKKSLSGSDTIEALKKKIEEEMKKAMGGFYYADDVKEQLIIQSEKLRKLAADEIEKLKAAGKHELAFGLEKLDKVVMDLETQLHALNPQTEIGKGLLAVLEAGLKKAETAMEAEIKKLSGSFFADEKKDDLLAQTDKLKKLAADEIAKLKAEGKMVLAAGIEKLDKTLVDIETQLKGLNPQTEVGKGLLAIVEAGLKKVETALEAEIKKLSGGFFADEKKDELLAQTDKLKKLAADEIAKLKAEGKQVLAAGIQKLDKTLVDLETQLKGLNPQTEVGKGLLAIVEAGLKKVETALEAEIKKLSGGFFADEKKDDLLAQTDKLKKLAADEIAKLKAEGKMVLAAGIEKLDKTLVDIETQLKGLNPQTEVGKGLLAVVEAGLKKVETALEAEIKKLSGGFFADEKKDELLAQTDKLKKLAADEIAKLKAEGKVVLAAGIQKLDKTLVDLETQLKGLNPQTEVGKGLLAIVEAGLKKVETALEAEIKKLSGGFYADDELEKLKAQLEDELKKMGSTSPVIDDIRAKIEAELKKMAGGFF